MAGAGDLDRRVRIERAISTANEFNEPVPSWAELTTVWASRRDASDGERLAAGQVGSTLRSRFVVRSSSVMRGVTPVDRLVHEGAVWNIEGVKETPDGRRRYLEITATRDLD